MARGKRARKWRAPKSEISTRGVRKRGVRKHGVRKSAAKKGRKRAPKSGARAMWKGTITIGSVNVPVKLYSAVTDKSIHFRLLDNKRKEPVKQHMIDPETGDVVPNDQIKSAYQTLSGQLVVLDDEELDAAEPQESRDIEITRFVDVDDIAPAWYNRPYYLGPDGDASKSYFALAKALANQKKEGIARWVMRKKDYVGALKAEGDYLVLITLRHAGEVVSASKLTAPGGRELEKREVEMAKQLVEVMEGDFDIAAFKDEYRERVLELVEAKAAGKVVRFPKAPRKIEQRDLASVLAKSLAAQKRRKSA